MKELIKPESGSASMQKLLAFYPESDREKVFQLLMEETEKNNKWLMALFQDFKRTYKGLKLLTKSSNKNAFIPAFKGNGILHEGFSTFFLKYIRRTGRGHFTLRDLKGTEGVKWIREAFEAYRIEEAKLLTGMNPEEIKIDNAVHNFFKFMLKKSPRNNRPILNDSDFNRLKGWVTEYFKNDFKLPEIHNPIDTVNTSKGNVVWTFKFLCKELNPELDYPQSLWVLIKKSFHEYRRDTCLNISKANRSKYYTTLNDYNNP